MAEETKAEFRFYPTGKIIDESGKLVDSQKECFEWWRETKDDDGNVIHRQLIGQYWPSMGYNCTAKPVHDVLRAMCKLWEKKGMIRIEVLGAGQKFVTMELRGEA